jgi:hypothetical protein
VSASRRRATSAGGPIDISPETLGQRRDEIADRRATLERRLDDGYQRIDAALKDGQDVDRWEDFWIGLLREYEALVGRTDRAA